MGRRPIIGSGSMAPRAMDPSRRTMGRRPIVLEHSLTGLRPVRLCRTTGLRPVVLYRRVCLVRPVPYKPVKSRLAEGQSGLDRRGKPTHSVVFDSFAFGFPLLVYRGMAPKGPSRHGPMGLRPIPAWTNGPSAHWSML